MNKKKNILVIPAASPKYENTFSKVFNYNEDGIINIIDGILKMPHESFDKIIITITNTVNEKFNIANRLFEECNDKNINNVNVLVLDNCTRNQVDTVFKTISSDTDIDGGVFIKDADSIIKIDEIPENDTVYTYKLENVDMIRPTTKSYIAKTNEDIVTNIIEKRVIGSEFCAGGYYFSDVFSFIDYCVELSEYDNLYMSDLMFHSILNHNNIIKAELVEYFKDV